MANDNEFTFRISSPQLISITKMLTEILVIFSTTILIWLVLKEPDINNGSCDLSEIFKTDSIAKPEPFLEFQCQELPTMSEFVDFWAQRPSLTNNMDRNSLKTFIQTVEDDFCDTSSILTSTAAFYTAVGSMLILLNKYIVEYREDRLKDFVNSGVLSDLVDNNKVLCAAFAINCAIISVMYIVDFGLLLSQSYSGSQTLIKKACIYGKDVKFEITCYLVFSVAFALTSFVITVYLIRLVNEVQLKVAEIKKHPRLKDKLEAFEKTLENFNNNPDKDKIDLKPLVNHDCNLFFKEFGEDLEFDEDKLQLTIKNWDTKHASHK